jgi:hypothetical protein
LARKIVKFRTEVQGAELVYRCDVCGKIVVRVGPDIDPNRRGMYADPFLKEHECVFTVRPRSVRKIRFDREG